MNVAVIGSGGREHALAHKLHQSPKLNKLYIIPGNTGTEKLGENIDLDSSDKNTLKNFCNQNDIALVVIGPEQPLVDGLADYLRSCGIKVFGPNKKAAQIEGDKIFAKNLMKKYNIPTAEFETFEEHEFERGLNYIKSVKYPLVIKASGIAAGKGVAICNNYDEARQTLHDNMQNRVFGEAGLRIVIEEFLRGEETSIFVITDGSDYLTLPSSQDHKRIFDGDKGKNTGGMGAYAPAPIVTPEIMKNIEAEIIIPTISALKNEGIEYNGCLYCGLMLSDEGPKVVEFNCRFGDPETQAVLPIIEGDFLELLFSTAEFKLNKNSVTFLDGSAVCVVAASEGYPGKYEKGYEINGLELFDNDPEILVFHAGTKRHGEKVVTNGGRVLGVTSFIKNNNLKYCKTKSYEALAKISFKGIYYRKDISDKAFRVKL